MVVKSTRERAQVILIGAIVIAFVILGVVVVLNGLVHTEEMSTSETTQGTSHAEATQYEVENLIHGTAKHDVEQAGGWEKIIEDGKDLEDIFRDEDEWRVAILTGSELHGNLTASSRPAYSNVSDDPIHDSASLGANFDAMRNPGHSEVLNTPGTTDGAIFHFEVGGGTPNMEGEFVFEEVDGNMTYIEVKRDNPTRQSVTANVTGDHISGERSCRVEGSDPGINFVTGDVSNEIPGCEDMEILNSSMHFEQVEYNAANGQVDYEIIGLGEIPNADDEVPGALAISHSYESNNVNVNSTITVNLYGAYYDD